MTKHEVKHDEKPAEVAKVEEKTTETTAPVKTLANIIRGRMPAVIVFMVRHGDNKGESTKALATMFGTTSGKIDDIKKGHNFGYIKANFKPTQSMVDEGIAYLQRHPDFNKGTVDKLINELNALPIASAEEAAAFEATRTEVRAPRTTTADGQVANGGGGNRRGKPENRAKPAETAEAADPKVISGDALLA